MRREYVIERVNGLLLAASIPIGVTLALELGLQLAGARQPAMSAWQQVAQGLLVAASAWLACRCGMAFVRLQFAPIYPRESFYGDADIAPELPGRDRIEHALLPFGMALVLLPAAIATPLISGKPVWAPWLGLLAGVGLQGWRCRRLVDPAHVRELELRLRGDYLLYLRSFGKSGLVTALATLQAAAPLRALMIVSPRRIESRTWGWYAVSALLYRTFDRLALWSTVDDEWDRVVASCMARSSAMVVDCAGLEGSLLDGQGISLELGISLGFSEHHRTAYVLKQGQHLPGPFPVPAALWLAGSWWGQLLQFRPTVARLGAVTRRQLTAAEESYIDGHFAMLAQHYRDAMISDAIHAQSEGKDDPRAWLLARRSKRNEVPAAGSTP